MLAGFLSKLWLIVPAMRASPTNSEIYLRRVLDLWPFWSKNLQKMYKYTMKKLDWMAHKNEILFSRHLSPSLSISLFLCHPSLLSGSSNNFDNITNLLHDEFTLSNKVPYIKTWQARSMGRFKWKILGFITLEWTSFEFRDIHKI